MASYHMACWGTYCRIPRSYVWLNWVSNVHATRAEEDEMLQSIVVSRYLQVSTPEALEVQYPRVPPKAPSYIMYRKDKTTGKAEAVLVGSHPHAITRRKRPTCVGRRCSLEWPYPHLCASDFAARTTSSTPFKFFDFRGDMRSAPTPTPERDDKIPS